MGNIMSSKRKYKTSESQRKANRKWSLKNRERKAEANRKWYLANRERKAEANKKWYLKNSDYYKTEKRAEYDRKRYLANQERKKEYNRKWRLANSDYHKEYRQTEAGKKTNRIGNWKTKGIKDFNLIKYILSEKFPKLGTGFYKDNYNTIYRLFTIQKICSCCYKVFNTENRMDFKCIDHSHETGFMRRICCVYCNLKIIK